MILDELDFPPHVRAELNEGRLWRAKEILRGHIGTYRYSPDLYEQYGVILLEMKDLLQAGKYLFLSGRRRPEYEEPIALFLERHGNKDGDTLASAFPARVQSRPIEMLPWNVQQELLSRGMREKEPAKPLVKPKGPVRGVMAMLGCIVVTLLAFAIVFRGAVALARDVVELFR